MKLNILNFVLIACLFAVSAQASDESVEIFPLYNLEESTPATESSVFLTHDFPLAQKPIEVEPAPIAEMVEPKIEVLEQIVPIPPKRPNKFKVSTQFLEKIKQQQKEAKSVKVARPPFQDKSGLEFFSPSGQEMLSHIEPSAGKPKPAPVAAVKIPAQPIRKGKNIISVNFLSGETDIQAKEQPAIAGEILARAYLNQDQIQLHAYAETDEGQTGAKRISLMRAIGIRDFLVENNVEAKRISIKALGDETKASNKDKVDIVFVNLST